MKKVQNTEKKEFGKHATYPRRMILQRVDTSDKLVTDDYRKILSSVA